MLRRATVEGGRSGLSDIRAKGIQQETLRGIREEEWWGVYDAIDPEQVGDVPDCLCDDLRAFINRAGPEYAMQLAERARWVALDLIVRTAGAAEMAVLKAQTSRTPSRWFHRKVATAVHGVLSGYRLDIPETTSLTTDDLAAMFWHASLGGKTRGLP